jgi:hypothetical protein
MLYQAYQAQTDLMVPVRAVAEFVQQGFRQLPVPYCDSVQRAMSPRRL